MLLILMGIFLVLAIFLFGVLMLRLHHLLEHIAHKEQKIQYQFVATLGLLGMFTHETSSDWPRLESAVLRNCH